MNKVPRGNLFIKDFEGTDIHLWGPSTGQVHSSDFIKGKWKILITSSRY
jgi:hypothetical protein